MKNWLALDIGGANIKLADGKKYARSHSFALWRDPNHLSQELRTLIAEAPVTSHLAITMTGELADCFESKMAGVQYILQAVAEAADNRHTRVYLSNGKLVTPQVAVRKAKLAAASNWHALARYAGRIAPEGTALLMDIGSTTCDLVPLQDGEPTATAETDTQRLISGELLYTGVERSPLCAVIRRVPYRDGKCPVAQELFATMLDVYLVTGDLAEDAAEQNTADGKPAVKGAARIRLGRMICADKDEFNHRDAVAIALAAAEAQTQQIASAARLVLDRLPQPPETVILSGQGEFLARRVLQKLELAPRMVSLGKELTRMISKCATAHALAVLTAEAEGPS